MPVPIRDDGHFGPTEHLVLFIHGFSSNAGCWNSLKEQLERDVTLTQSHSFVTFDYETAILRLKPLQRLPSLEEVALELGRFLERTLADAAGRQNYIDVTLVGHSMGGLVIQSYLTRELEYGRGKGLDRFRQAIFFGTPNFGSELLGLWRQIVSIFFPNPQEESLRSLNSEIKHVHRAMREHIIDASIRSEHSYPLPCYCFWGDSDNIVKEHSARGYFPYGEPLRGDHMTMKEVNGFDDPRYQAFITALVNPYGHTHIWEVDNYKYSVAISPRRIDMPVVARRRGKELLLETDNVARVERTIRFGRHNNCLRAFPLRYATRNDGWIDAQMPKHVTSAEKLRQYEDTGTEVIAEVIPDAETSSSLKMTVYKGFDAGQRDYHMHLGRSGYYRKLEFEVDLTAYIAAGWRVTKGPQLYFHPIDPGTHDWCKERKTPRPDPDPDPPSDYESNGRWRWSLDHVKEGIIDIEWDVTPPNAVVARESPSVIELKTGEYAIVGYGSLLSITSLERTLGRKYSGPFVVCDLIGWYRTWDVSMPNSTFEYLNEAGTWITPERILYLNLKRNMDRRINAVLFVITDEDMKAFDEREWIYDRVIVDDELRGVSVVNGHAWAFVGKPEHILKAANSPPKTAIRRSYLDILEAGVRDLGADFRDAYENSTDLPPQHLIIPDHKRDRHPAGA